MTPFPATHLRTAALSIVAVAALILLVDVGGPPRAVALLPALLLAPGLAAVPALRLDSSVAQLAMAVGLSVAALVLVSEVLLYLGVAGAGWAFTALASGTVLACLAPRGGLGPGDPP